MKFSIEELEQCYSKVIETYFTHTNTSVEPQLDFCFLKNDNFNFDLICKSLLKVFEKSSNLKCSFSIPCSINGLNQNGLSMLKKLNDNKIPLNKIILNCLITGFYIDEWENKMGDASIKILESLKNQIKSNYRDGDNNQIDQSIAITPMIGKNLDSSMFTFDDVKKLSKWVHDNNQIAYISFWNLNRDNPLSKNDNDLDAEITSCSNKSQKESLEYTKTFLKELK